MSNLVTYTISKKSVKFSKIVQLLLIKGILRSLCHTFIVHGNVAVVKCEVIHIKTPRKGMLGPLWLTEATEACEQLVISKRAAVVVPEAGLVSVQASALHA